jgi:hypothetical protein
MNIYVIERRYANKYDNIGCIFKMGRNAEDKIKKIIRNNLSNSAIGRHFGFDLATIDDFRQRILSIDADIEDIDIDRNISINSRYNKIK